MPNSTPKPANSSETPPNTKATGKPVIRNTQMPRNSSRAIVSAMLHLGLVFEGEAAGQTVGALEQDGKGLQQQADDQYQDDALLHVHERQATGFRRALEGRPSGADVAPAEPEQKAAGGQQQHQGAEHVDHFLGACRKALI